MRVLVTSTPGRGHLGPLLPVATALRDAGHEVRWATAAEACETVAGLGFAVDPAGLDVVRRRAVVADRLPRIMALPPRQRRGHLFAGFFAEAAAPAMAADVRPLVESFRPDLVVHETAELGIVPLAVERGIPHVVVAFSGPVPAYTRCRRSPPSSLRGGRASASTFRRMPGWSVTSTCTRSPPPSTPIRRGPSSGWGPSRSNPRHASSRRRGWRRSGPPDRPCTSPSAPSSAALDAPWPALLEAIGDREIDALVTTGAHADVGAFGRLPGNVRVERYVPQGEVLPRVAAVVSHAGAGTMLGAASAGVPQLVVPIFADQWDNADAIASAGAAIVCEEDERTAESLGSALDRVLADDGCRTAAASVAREMSLMPPAADHVPQLEATARIVRDTIAARRARSPSTSTRNCCMATVAAEVADRPQLETWTSVGSGKGSFHAIYRAVRSSATCRNGGEHSARCRMDDAYRVLPGKGG